MMTVRYIIITAALLVVLCIPAQAQSHEFEMNEQDNLYGELYSATEIGGLEDAAPKEFSEFADETDITPLNPLSFQKLIEPNAIARIGEYIKSRLLSPVSAAAVMLTAILLCALAGCMYEGTLSGSLLNTVSVLVCTAAFMVPVAGIIENGCSAVTAAASFMTAFTPIFAGILIAAARAHTAVGFAPVMYFASNAVGYIGAYIVSPVASMYLATGIAGSLTEGARLSGLSALLKKAAVWTISGAMSVYIAVMSMQTVICSVSDSAATKTAKFFVSSFVPIIGASLSEALSSLGGCVGVLKSSVALYAVLILLFITVPVIIELLIYKLTLSFCSVSAQLFSLTGIKAVADTINSALSVILAVVLCVSVMFIFSVTVLAAVSGKI